MKGVTPYYNILHCVFQVSFHLKFKTILLLKCNEDGCI